LKDAQETTLVGARHGTLKASVRFADCVDADEDGVVARLSQIVTE